MSSVTCGIGVAAADFDNDGRTDIFVCNDQRWNFLFHNEGGGKFQEVGLAAGVVDVVLAVNGETRGVEQVCERRADARDQSLDRRQDAP